MRDGLGFSLYPLIATFTGHFWYIFTRCVSEDCDHLVDIVLTCLYDRFYSEFTLECEWHHNLVREPSFLYLSEPVSCNNLVAWLSDRSEIPKLLVVERVCVFSSLEEYTCHCGQVILQTVIAA